MTLTSMTGFSRAEGGEGACRWYWEVRSVNGRGLDVRVRVPAGLDVVEVKAREVIGKRFTRGNVNATLNLKRDGGEGQIRINEQALKQVVAATERIRATMTVSSIRPEGLLGLKGVLEVVEAEDTPEDRERLIADIVATLETAVTGMAEARRAEGQRLAVVLTGHLDEIARLVAEVRTSAQRAPEALRARLGEQVKRLIDVSSGLDAQRLHQEAVLLATRYDIEEEVNRLEAHIASGRELLVSTDAIGRRLDFLAQEFNREANTICSKAFDGEISKIGLALKVVIDQLREQVQNIE